MKSFLFIILLTSEITLAQTGNLKGTVTDGSSPIPSVNIILLHTSFGTSSDNDGYYEINGIDVGSYQVKFSVI